MKNKILILIICLILIITGLYFNNNKLKIENDGITVKIPNHITHKIEKELLDISNDVIDIINDDSMDGYSMGLGSYALSKEGVKKIYQILKDKNICIDDEQGYYDLENKNIFESFWNDVLNQENSSFVYYTITLDGSIERRDYYYQDEIFYCLYSELNLDEENPQVNNIYGEKIEDVKYDNGYFYYHRIVEDLIKVYGGIEYGYIRIESIGEENREYTQKYISTIDYQCTNIFTQDWDNTTMNKLNFNDLIKYLYELKYDSPFYSDEYEYSLNPFVKKLDAEFIEPLVQEYFTITSKNLKKYSVYDDGIYYYNEACCVPSKLETPQYKGEVIEVQENNDLLILTIQVHGYQFGYDECFTHKLTIKKEDKQFKYYSNEIITSHHIPTYMNGVSKEAMKTYK